MRPTIRPIAQLALCALVTVGAFAPASAAGQTTPTEREAAADVLAEIDALQERIDPRGQALARVARDDADRDAIMDRVQELWLDEMMALSNHIGNHPEVGWAEYETVDTLAEVLRSYGFAVEMGVADLETAFVGSWTSPAGASRSVGVV